MLLGLAVGALCGSRWLAAEPFAQLAEAEEVIERFSIPKDSYSILLPVAIKGKRYRLALDTGAYCTVYDKPLWSLLGKTKALEKFAEGNFTAPFFDPPDARLSKLTLPKDSLVMGTDMKEMHEDFGEDEHGLLGIQPSAARQFAPCINRTMPGRIHEIEPWKPCR